MARDATRTKVHDAVLSLVGEGHVGSLTMEGIAARAAVSKQTLYRSWRTTGVILFDALLARSEGPDGAIAVPDSGDLAVDMITLATAMVAELTHPDIDPVLRAITAALQTDEALATQYRDMLLRTQMAAVAQRLRSGGVADADEAAELFVGPIMHRWLLRSRPFDPEWISRHVGRVLRAAG